MTPSAIESNDRPTVDEPHELLREEIRFLGEQLGAVIRQLEGQAAFECVERIRNLARDFRQGNDQARVELTGSIAEMSPAEMRVVIRAFTIFLNLANLAEDRHRLRILRHRHAGSEAGIRQQSIHDAFVMLRNLDVQPESIQNLLRTIDVELVFTAHPTEAKRRTVRSKLRQLREQLQSLDADLLPSERLEIIDRIRNELVKLWQTDLVRPKRPTVMQEVERGLSIKRALWDTLPEILNDFRNAAAAEFPELDVEFGPVLRYGSWIGGDRDGHPYVTVDITDQTVQWLRHAALEFHQKQCQCLRGSLSFSSQSLLAPVQVETRINERLDRWPALAEPLKQLPKNEPLRQWLVVIGWRLHQTKSALNSQLPTAGAYESAGELAADVQQIRDCLDPTTNELAIRFEIQPWLDRIAAFGFHLARLDIRQDASRHRDAVNELLIEGGLHADPDALDDEARCQLIEQQFYNPFAIDEDALSDATRETIALFRWLAGAVERFGHATFGGYVISMTHRPSDLLHVLWLWEFARENDASCLPLIPLFETIDDLQQADVTLANSLDSAIYHAHVAHWNNRQTLMLGYSDGTKDGGYLAACWALFDAQRRLTHVANQRDLQLVFFHGRGGSLGRGGGPAARSILALPKDSFHGQLRLTEQGEILAERYDDPRIAYRHLEQILWATLIAGASRRPTKEPLWEKIMQTLAVESRKDYRRLIDDPRFVEFFRKTTPLEPIELLPIGSRPSRRQDSIGLEGLRAIPFVFSWTQCRWLVPAWYGLGSAIAQLRREQPEAHAELRRMYADWPFFQAIIDNATLALAKADVSIGRMYGDLAKADPDVYRLCEQIHDEYELTLEAALEITSTSTLLQRIPWLNESIQVRNYYVDPINMIQIELLRRIQSGAPWGEAEDVDSLVHLIRLTINGIASGMRTTG